MSQCNASSIYCSSCVWAVRVHFKELPPSSAGQLLTLCHKQWTLSPSFTIAAPPCVIITVVPCCFYKDTTAFTDNTMQWLKNDPHIAERQKHFRNSANIISLVIEFKSLIQAMVTLNELSLYVVMKSSVSVPNVCKLGSGMCCAMSSLLLTSCWWCCWHFGNGSCSIFLSSLDGYNISITMFSTTTF